jgi:HD superfamily phosphohydrolase
MNKQRFLDPLYGAIEVDDGARALAFSPEFQRLRYVRLCNIHSLYLTGASEPKRFEHCLGVYHLADLWTRARGLTGRQASVVKAAALLHDLMTGPFGHSFQYVLEDNEFKQRFEHANLAGGTRARFHQMTQANLHFAGREFMVQKLLGELADDVFEAIDGRGPFGPIISGSLDLDNLDNVVRLAFHMGLCDDEERGLPVRLAPMLEPVEDGLASEPAAEPLLLRWFDIRKRLYEFLLLDRGEFAAKAMLTLAVELAAAGNLLEVNDWLLTDEHLLDQLEEEGRGEAQVVGQIVKRLRVGDLFECAGVWRSPSVEAYESLSAAADKRALEQSIEERISQKSLGAVPRICIHYILDKKKTCRSLTYRDLSTGEKRTIGYDSSSLLVGVFVTNARASTMTTNEENRVAEATLEELRVRGLRDIEAAAEPLAEAAKEMELFA